MKSLSSKDRKKIGVLLYNHLQHHHNLGKVESAESTAVALGIEKRSVTRWHKEYYREKGDISGDKRGKYTRLALLNQEDITRKSVKWLREKVHNAKYFLTAAKFQSWLNEYLSTLNLPEHFPKAVSEVTAYRYLRKLGFHRRQYRQGYTDGHDRPDVVEYRKLFLKKLKILESSHLPPPICEDGIPSWNSGNVIKA